jgi:hypothetical protein
MKKITIWLLVAILLTSCTPTVQRAVAPSYYVATTGNDANPGSLDAPFKTIARGISAAPSGSLLYIREGTYNEALSVSKALTIAPYNEETVILDGQKTRSDGIRISAANVTIFGLFVWNFTQNAVYISSANNVTIDGLTIYIPSGRGIFAQESSGLIIRGNAITTTTNSASQTDGIYSQRNASPLFENNNIVISNTDANGHDDGIQSYQDTSAVFSGNYVEQRNSKVSNAQGIYATTGYGLFKFYNNVINLTNAQSNALSFRRLPSLGGTGNVEIVGNTVYGVRPYHGIWVTEVDAPVVRNNISYTPNGVALTLSGSTTGVSNNLTTDPRFVNIANNDFHLAAGSPAIDKGVTLPAPYNIDKDGVSRPQGSAFDIGAYEFTSGAPVTVVPPTATLTITPSLTSTPVPPTVTPTFAETPMAPTETFTPTPSATPTRTINEKLDYIIQMLETLVAR